MLKYDAVEDLCSLTALKKTKLDKVLNKLSDVICDDTLETKLKGESSVELNIGFGTLLVSIGEKDKVSYNFIPSKKLSRNMNKTLKGSKSVVEEKLEKDIVNALIMPFKELY